MKINNEQRLYIIPCGDGFSCLGFDVLTERATALSIELGYSIWTEKPGTEEAYRHYRRLVAESLHRFNTTGRKSETELHPQLIGLEGKRVEVINQEGSKYRFIVGKSTGHIPCHLEIKTKRSTCGDAVDSRPFISVRVV